MKLSENIMLELQEDYVGLWELYREAAALNVESSNIESIVLEAVGELLSNDGVQFGYFERDNFIPFHIPAADVINMIKDRSQTLGRVPDIGEIGWFFFDA